MREIEIDKLQPSQLYIEKERFQKIFDEFDPENYEPVPVNKKVTLHKNKWIIIDWDISHEFLVHEDIIFFSFHTSKAPDKKMLC